MGTVRGSRRKRKIQKPLKISGTTATSSSSGATMSYLKSSCRNQPRSRTLPTFSSKRQAERLGPNNQQAVNFLDAHREQKQENRLLRKKERLFFFSENVGGGDEGGG